MGNQEVRGVVESVRSKLSTLDCDTRQQVLRTLLDEQQTYIAPPRDPRQLVLPLLAQTA